MEKGKQKEGTEPVVQDGPPRLTPAEIKDHLRSVMAFFEPDPMRAPRELPSIAKPLGVDFKTLEYLVLHWNSICHAFHNVKKKLLPTIIEIFQELGQMSGDRINHITPHPTDEDGISVNYKSAEQIVNHARFATGEFKDKSEIRALFEDKEGMDALEAFAAIMSLVDAIHMAYLTWRAPVLAKEFEERKKKGELKEGEVAPDSTLFTNKETGKPVSILSGGERGKLSPGLLSVYYQDIVILAALRRNEAEPFAPPLKDAAASFFYDDDPKNTLFDAILRIPYGKAFFDEIRETQDAALLVLGVI